MNCVFLGTKLNIHKEKSFKNVLKSEQIHHKKSAISLFNMKNQVLL